ncbi:MAG: response regulator transcription factor [Sphingobacteriales bacterium]|nr:MAG: response regulator transcription factor [Sphingobacteriales bacterium]
MSLSICIIEDDKNYNNILRKVIDHAAGMSCIAQYYYGKDALTGIPALQPDIVLVDIRLNDLTGIEIVARLKPALMHTEFIMCTTSDREDDIFEALKAGATGYLIKGENIENIIAALNEVKNGGAPMSLSIAKKVTQFFHRREDKKLEQLTRMENEVLNMLSKGMLYKEIAANKFVSMDTVKKHIANIYKKLAVNNKIEAINKLKNL